MTIDTIAHQLAAVNNPFNPLSAKQLPSPVHAAELMNLIRELIVPRPERPEKSIAVVSNILDLMAELVADRAVVEAFVEELPEIIRLVRTDIVAVSENDPAATSAYEVAVCYPAATAMLHYRTAHALHRLGQKLLARIITEQAHSQTGIDIHPAARIGEAFAIDHGTGVVIGSTAIVGNHVTIYQGVTLGARHFSRTSDGRLADMPRHPIVEDYVTIYSNTSVLGRIHIGHHATIGGNLWITRDVPSQTVVRQQPPQQQPGFADGAGI